ncbi:MAG: hypothetical protein PHS41_04115 [Victivallaceae bacterium]|nr:hypothetical protein [Victivallaceae bacterium]
MSLLNDSVPTVRDERVRDYLFVKRILWQQRCEHCQLWVDNRKVQPLLIPCDGAILEPNGAVLVDFSLEFHGGIRLLIHGSGGKIRLSFGESASEAMQCPDQSHAIHQTELEVPGMGMMEYGNTAFRFVRIDNIGPAALKIPNLIGVASYRDLPLQGFFESSDARLNQIWKTAVYTVQLNMQDYIYDGVKRDRIVWMGDMHPEVRGILASFGDPTLIERSLDFLVENTAFPNVMNNITTYSCWYVICLADLYRATGNKDFLSRHKTYLQDVLQQFSGYISEDGAECIPERRFLDWPNNDDPIAKHAGLQGLLCWMMKSGAYLLQEMQCDNSFALLAARKLGRHIPECADSKAAAALQTLSGIADRSALLLKNPFQGVSTFYGFYMLLAQPTVSALALIRRYWGGMLDRGATTFWEDFDLDWLEKSGRIDELTGKGELDLHADFGKYCYKGLRHSLCHGWSCGPAPFMSERMFGVKFLTPGGDQVSISPDLGDIEYLRGAYPTPHGPIGITLEKGLAPKIELPPGVELKIDPPRNRA